LTCCAAIIGLALPVTAQELPAPSLRPDLPVSAYLDWGVGISGEKVITISDILRAESDPSQDWGRQLQLGAQRGPIQISILQDLAMTQLEIDAGRVRGFDPKLVESLVNNHFERQVERYGGATNFTKRLHDWRMTPSRFRMEVTSDLYRYAWRDSSLGKQPGPTGRVSVDRYIRPGYLYSTYKAFSESADPEKLMIVGGSAEEAILQRIILPLDEHAPELEPDAGLEKVTLLAKQLRTQVLEGEATFEAQANAWDANRGQSEPIQRTLDEIRGMSRTFHNSDLLYEFATTAQVGHVSVPLPFEASDGRQAMVLYALSERLPATPPKPFSDLQVQESLREHLLSELDRRRMTRARLHLVQKSHLHPKDLRPVLMRREIQGH
jgi:hypothetical protein